MSGVSAAWEDVWVQGARQRAGRTGTGLRQDPVALAADPGEG